MQHRLGVAFHYKWLVSLKSGIQTEACILADVNKVLMEEFANGVCNKDTLYIIVYNFSNSNWQSYQLAAGFLTSSSFSGETTVTLFSS